MGDLFQGLYDIVKRNADTYSEGPLTDIEGQPVDLYVSFQVKYTNRLWAGSGRSSSAASCPSANKMSVSIEQMTIFQKKTGKEKKEQSNEKKKDENKKQK